MRILGVDPGSRRCGYGVVDVVTAGALRIAYVECGVIEPPARDPLELRLADLASSLAEVIAELAPDAVAVEDVFHGIDARAALVLGHARGVVLAQVGAAKLPLYAYPPATVKKAVTGYGQAGKEQVGGVVKALLGLGKAPRTDAADALAVAICHAHHARSAEVIARAAQESEIAAAKAAGGGKEQQMIAQLRGTLVEKSLDRVVVDVGGVGYGAIVSLNTLAALPEPGHPVTIKTYLQIREDAHVLYGFATDDERRAFELCISVSGIGPKLAISLLSTLRPEMLADAVRSEDVARLSRTPGVGKKTAERLVMELRDKIDKAGLGSSAGVTRPAAATGGIRGLTGIAATVASALANLGYRPDEAERAAKEAVKGREGEPLEVLVRESLRTLTG